MSKTLRPAALVCTLAFLVTSLHGATSSLQFDAASVKPSAPDRRFAMKDAPGRIDYRQFGIKTLIWVAFQAPLPQIVGPDWLSHHSGGTYDVSATFPAGTTEAQQHLMLQNLLVDRFKLAVHREMQEGKVYALVVSDHGLKIHKARNPPAEDVLSFSVEFAKDGLHLSDKLPDAPEAAPHGIKISKLVKYLNNGLLDRVVIDQTGLEGYYDVDLVIRPGLAVNNPTIEPDTKVPVMPSIPMIFNALEKQLGLKVKTQSAPVEMLVIDHLEREPLAN